ncbi:MAG: DHH family phosphoesterase [Phycisphaeraceae bacterium]
MTDYVSNASLEAIADRLRQARGDIVIVTHAKPDGDAIGSALALTLALHRIHKPAHAFLVAPVAEFLRELDAENVASVIEPDDADALPHDAALYVVVDTGAYGQLGPQQHAIEKNLKRTIVIDHHLSGDVRGHLRYIDGNAAACCEIIAILVEKLLDTNGWDRPIADLLFAGIACDTGWFRFSNTNPDTHRLAARLLEMGVDHAELYGRLEQRERPEKLRLLVRALESLELLCSDRVAVMSLHKKDFEETGALEHETERLVDTPQIVGSVRVVALITEATNHGGNGKPLTRVSFRAKPGDDAVNVAALAQRFGGGGHARAAGAKIEASVDEVLAQLRQAVPEALEAVAGDEMSE